jgi:hypothetical protein
MLNLTDRMVFPKSQDVYLNSSVFAVKDVQS